MPYGLCGLSGSLVEELTQPVGCIFEGRLSDLGERGLYKERLRQRGEDAFRRLRGRRPGAGNGIAAKRHPPNHTG